MSEVNPKCFQLSASSIAAYKACPTRWRLLYREGLRPALDTESLRVGSNWHAMHEEHANALAAGISKDDALQVVIDHLNTRYAECPATKTILEWGLERQILLTCFVGYLWYWQEDQVEILHSELPFDLPVHNPTLGLPLLTSEVLRVGKIDHVVKWQGMVGTIERKSTSRAIAPDSDYWDKAKKDTQVSMYALAFKDMASAGQLPDTVVKAWADNPRLGNTLYDVWHRPTIKPAMLTQKETAEFIETKTYCEQAFDVSRHDDAASVRLDVDGEDCEVEVGKKGFAIRETTGMYAARLLQDIYTRPDFYYARREIVRTDAELRKFRGDLYSIYQGQKTMAATGHYFENESQCRATFACSMIPVCYGPGADAVCDGKTTPANYKRIFVDLTVNGAAAEEE